ncbi:MAG TPA: hypothetical protein VEH04_02595 [Verrucomicrobiae bacterium]|nr:hypothetical protein [Verrucomicrobiae bacterium]
MGCRSLPGLSRPMEKPDNIYSAAPVLPETIRRVAVLPIASSSSDPSLLDGREKLGSTVLSELAKTGKFEPVLLEPNVCRARTGQAAWTAEEWLPHHFFTAVQEATGCDAVLFAQLTVFKGHAPLAVGWRMKLVDVRTQTVLWACDEVFDGGKEAVLEGAHRYQQEHLHHVATDGRWAMRNSPQLFGQFTVAQLLETLPQR